MIKVRRVRQEHSTSCGIACVAMITGIPYRKVLAIAKEQIRWRRDNSFYTNYVDLKVLLSFFNVKYGYGRMVKHWDSVSDLAIVAINYSEKYNNWHWVVFCRENHSQYVLDPKSKTEKRTDFSRMRLRSYLPIKYKVI